MKKSCLDEGVDVVKCTIKKVLAVATTNLQFSLSVNMQKVLKISVKQVLLILFKRFRL